LKKVLSKIQVRYQSALWSKTEIRFFESSDDEFMKRNFSDDDVEKFLFYEEKIN
jgi:hypothetical protein